MRIYTIFVIFLSALMLNGCLIDRIKQRLYYEKILKQKQHLPKKRVKVYKPSKPNSELYAKPDNIEVIPKESKIKKKRSKKHYVKKVKKEKGYKITKEPYSISDNEKDPELLGPQTTLKSNPLTKKSLEEKKKKI